MVNLLFYLFAALILAGGLLSISSRQPVHSALWLVASLFGIAVLYVLMSAEFLFAVQIFIYAGGIMVLYLFVIFLVETARSEGATSEPRLHRVLGPPIVLIFSPVLIYLLMDLPVAAPRPPKLPTQGGPITVEQVMELGPRDADDPRVHALVKSANDPRFRDIGNTKVLGLQLFTRYLFPFEIISIVLLVAMLGAIVLGRRRFSSYTQEEESRMLAEAHYHGRRISQPSGESPERILAELKEDAAEPHLPGREFKVFPEYEE